MSAQVTFVSWCRNAKVWTYGFQDLTRGNMEWTCQYSNFDLQRGTFMSAPFPVRLWLRGH